MSHNSPKKSPNIFPFFRSVSTSCQTREGREDEPKKKKKRNNNGGKRRKSGHLGRYLSKIMYNLHPILISIFLSFFTAMARLYPWSVTATSTLTLPKRRRTVPWTYQERKRGK